MNFTETLALIKTNNISPLMVAIASEVDSQARVYGIDLIGGYDFEKVCDLIGVATLLDGTIGIEKLTTGVMDYLRYDNSILDLTYELVVEMGRKLK